MSLPETFRFDKEGQIEVPGPRLWLRKLFLSLLILLVGALSFGIGRLTAPSGRGEVKVEWDESLVGNQGASAIQALPTAPKSGEVVGSKNGSKYHYLHCPGAKQIREENKLFFPSSASAEASGYALAANCLPR